MTRLWFLAVLTCVVVVACERVPLTAPTSSTISLTVDQTTLPLNGHATVRAVVIESGGTPVHNGTQVVFSTILGSFNPVEANTINGVATSTFSAGGISGTTRINAYSGGASTGSGNSSGGGVEVKIGAAAAGSLTLSATPPSVSQSGGTVTISATVFDPNSNPLPGVNVNFSATTGALSATTALTDASGVARTQLATTSTATVTATAGTATRDVTVTVSTAPTITITATSPGNVGVPVPITVSATSGGSGNNTPRQIQTLRVDFGDGNSETRTNVTGSVSFAHTYTRAGGYTITATATDVAGNTGIASSSIVINQAQPTVTLTVPANVDFSDTNGVAGFTVAASAPVGQPPIQSVVVRLGDGTVIYSGSSGGSFTYQFGGVGTYAVNATVTDAAGGVATASGVVRVVP